MNNALEFAASNQQAFVDQLIDWLKIPSVSTDPERKDDVRSAAEWLAADFRRIGMKEVEIMETGGHPIVYASYIHDPSQPTIICYGHYDVQPPDPLDLWETPPFEPTIKNGDLYARGSSDDKGQAFMHVKAVESLLASGDGLPINIKFVVEGEEEVGSANLAPFLEKHKELLSADVGLISDTALFGPDTPSVTYGLRGLAYVQVELEGPNADLHSGVYGGAVENPLNALARMISNLHDPDHRVTVEGFYDDVQPLTDQEREAFAALPLDEEQFRNSVGVAETKTEAGYTALEGRTARPTLDINGIWGGYQGEGAKTVLPAKAAAKVSCRLVPDQDNEDITEKLRLHFEKHTPPTMKLTFTNLHGGSPFIVDTDGQAMRAAFDALKETFGKEPVLTRGGGSIPVVADLKKILGVDTILLGFGLNSDALHSPNERFGLDRFQKGIETAIRFYDGMQRR